MKGLATVAAPDPGLVLVLNAGSSSLKACLLSENGSRLWQGQRDCPMAEGASPEPVLDNWLPAALAPWSEAIVLAGHRVVHGGAGFTAPVRLEPVVLAALAELVPLAPLHNGPALRVMRWLTEQLPHLEQWACFDTAFHATLPPEAATYAIPADWRRQGLRRFGFHGLNHQHVAEVVAARIPPAAAANPLRLISCHLGAGCSLCAIAAGRSVDTTMGFTPLEGLVMATRCGSVDPGLLLHQLRRGLSVEELDQALNGRSGLLALSELSGSMQELRAAAAAGHEGAQLAIAVFRHRLLREIGAMAASLGGVDVLAFTGGIGEHDEALRQEVVGALSWLSPFDVIVIAADEEQVIARACRRSAAAAAVSH
ncbi:MAG: acetate kinase [Cyanobacteria bacterium]|nr:acetate kinase [Cyanobacteriota bacterium]